MKAEVYPDHIVLLPECPLESNVLEKATARGVEVSATRSHDHSYFGYRHSHECQSLSLWFAEKKEDVK